jgi:endonuclease/exonuclease/phosphatase family metal-dependent hydrolase
MALAASSVFKFGAVVICVCMMASYDAGVWGEAQHMNGLVGEASPSLPVDDVGAEATIRVLSWNTWFNTYRMDTRMTAIMDIVAGKQPHVVAFQEVTSVSWRALMDHDIAKDYEWSSPPVGKGYYTMIGCRRDWSHLRDVQRRGYGSAGSRQGRDLLSAVVGPPNKPLIVGTSHLESETSSAKHTAPSNKHFRRSQAKQALSFLAEAKIDAVFCGDTNIDEKLTDDAKPGADEIELPPGWVDQWHATGEGPGYTFDYARNGLVHGFDSWSRVNKQRVRFDRFWTRLSAYNSTRTEVLGTLPLSPLICPPRPDDDGKYDGIGDEPTRVVSGCQLPDEKTCVDDDAKLLEMSQGNYDCTKLASTEGGCTMPLQDNRKTVTDLNVCQCSCPAMETWPSDHFGVMLSVSVPSAECHASSE